MGGKERTLSARRTKGRFCADTRGARAGSGRPRVAISIDSLKSERDSLKTKLRELEAEQRRVETELKNVRQRELRIKREIEAISTLIELGEAESDAG